MNYEIPEGRLQRPSSNGRYISSFKQVLYRHGATMGAIAFLGLAYSLSVGSQNHFVSDFLSNPGIYLIAAGVLVGFFVFFLRFRQWELDKIQFLWIVYLLGISIVEEIAFRLTIPFFLAITLGSFSSILVSNLVFAAIHYLTLRWKLIPCIFTFMGGMGLSRLLENSENIALVILVHWFVTFLNTPRPPKNRTKNQTID